MEKITKSLEETQALAKEWVVGLAPRSSSASVVGLSGELGSGKTSFTQGVAKALGVEEHVTSPTFILERIYKIDPTRLQIANCKFNHLVHIDAYRLDHAHELKQIGFDELAADPSNLILIEWPERVAEGLPKDIVTLKFEFIDDQTRRIEW
ncbi:MAG TPA: tRNA (adenosine(37)-N6)-threonylcarbamoyltransferase complex ATPase subunit type 1 TsaE [Candidatus Paceibacterota bacterium]